MLDEQQRALVRQKLQGVSRPLVITLDPGPEESPFSRALVALLEELGELAEDKVQLRRSAAPLRPGYPAFQVANISYIAVPLELELEPFLDLLRALAAEVETPTPLPAADVEVLIAPTCPNCPKVVRACGLLAARRPEVTLSIIDVQYFHELARGCRSVPTVIIDGLHTVVGALESDELEELLREREQPTYAEKILASLIEAGRFDQAGAMLATDQGLEALATFLSRSAMQERMGILLLAEQVLAADPHSLDAALPYLIPLLESEDVALRGDTADLLGRIGAPGAREALSQLLRDDNPDVCEAASEALAALRQPS